MFASFWKSLQEAYFKNKYCASCCAEFNARWHSDVFIHDYDGYNLDDGYRTVGVYAAGYLCQALASFLVGCLLMSLVFYGGFGASVIAQAFEIFLLLGIIITITAGDYIVNSHMRTWRGIWSLRIDMALQAIPCKIDSYTVVDARKVVSVAGPFSSCSDVCGVIVDNNRVVFLGVVLADIESKSSFSGDAAVVFDNASEAICRLRIGQVIRPSVVSGLLLVTDDGHSDEGCVWYWRNYHYVKTKIRWVSVKDVSGKLQIYYNCDFDVLANLHKRPDLWEEN